MDLIIQPEEVGTLARPISQHIDREQLVAYITEVEQLQIRSALGGVLYSNIKQSPSAFDIILNGGIDEAGEVSGGIRKAMAYYVYARIIREGGTIATRFGAVEKTDEYSTRLEQERKNAIYRECNNIADAYMVEVVNYAKAQGWMNEQGVNSTRKMAYVIGGEEAGVNAYSCKSRQSVNAELVAGDGINIVDGEISVDMGEVRTGVGLDGVAQSVANLTKEVADVRSLVESAEPVKAGNGVIVEGNEVSVDFGQVATVAELNTIRTKANEAKTIAEDAKATAMSASLSATKASEDASEAKTIAVKASTDAMSVVALAEEAHDVATEAQEAVTTAITKAGNAEGYAQEAKTDATNAMASAKVASEASVVAQQSAQEATIKVSQVQGDMLGISVKDNGNIILSNANGESKEFMPATPSGDPMHYAYEALGAEYFSDVDVIAQTPWASFVDDADYNAKWGLNLIPDNATFVKNITYKGVSREVWQMKHPSNDKQIWVVAEYASDGTKIWDDTLVVERSGMWNMGGLGDLTNADIRAIINDPHPTSITGSCAQNKGRLLKFNNGIANIPIPSMFGYANKNIEVWNRGYQQSLTNVDIFRGAYIRHIVSSNKNAYIASVYVDLDLPYISTFYMGVNKNVLISIPNISAKSIIKLIDKTSSIVTVTFPSALYDRLMDTSTTLGAELVSLLESKTNITFARGE